MKLKKKKKWEIKNKYKRLDILVIIVCSCDYSFESNDLMFGSSAKSIGIFHK